jgi:predicted protein tyrosine phosphatase
MAILVSPLSRVRELVGARHPELIVSLLDPDFETPDLGYGSRHLRLTFHDIHVVSGDAILPSPRHVSDLLSFLKGWTTSGPLLVHCRAGIGRSTAAAYIAFCFMNPEVPELALAAALRDAAPLARPNETLIRIADSVMDRGGRMGAAIAETGKDLPWIDVDEGVPFELPSRFGDD